VEILIGLIGLTIVLSDTGVICERLSTHCVQLDGSCIRQVE